MKPNDLVVQRPEGLYCPPGDFYIDPWRPVARAVITHAHADHARYGHGHYLASSDAQGVLRVRLGSIDLQTLPYGERISHNGVTLSLHPAGHVLGSAQVRLEHGGQVWVASGDYKVAPDPTCAAFEPVKCDVFITESTFGMPIYRWIPDEELFTGINDWWSRNAAAGRASVLACYSFGKAQRVLAGVDASIGPIIVHGAVEPLNAAYREAGVALPPTRLVTDVADRSELRRALVVCPPSAVASTWLRRFGEASTAFASGWMQLRGARRRGGYDRGFVLSDHADWPGLMGAIGATGAQRVIVTHGSIAAMVRYLREQGLEAESFDTEYGSDDLEAAVEKGGSAELPAEPPQESAP
ncbi:ligase-associated DNA damage response exonuclease [Caenimonas koreensis DSM 17982]|uniref:Ligase-associated DNA damage response exonuclease n=1 Tax=Caenimonas koreensis DSM 17982 TaxID=1121255 RepID=A0A844AQG6_9BURK|nr:ligase-associated DNA damage response exonuclease [Caenimonas koreensis]MRD46244.1 ligase-associated DNA damage response exonuclease [Caenimonas koreensis DSM 17982]